MSEDIKIPFELVTLNGEPFIDLPVSGSVRPILPWRKPSDRPEDGEDVIILVDKQVLSATTLVDDQRKKDGWQFTIGEGALSNEEIDAWLYANEIPLPDWVKK